MQLYNKLSAIERAELIDKAGKERLTISYINITTLKTHKFLEIICFLNGTN